MAWWKLFWNPVEEVVPIEDEVFEQSAFESVISEPVISIVKAMISDRKRFIVQQAGKAHWREETKYEILDIDTEEEFFITLKTEVDVYGYDTFFTGPRWAAQHELKWACETVASHYYKMDCRARRISTIRERNRLIEIYA